MSETLHVYGDSYEVIDSKIGEYKDCNSGEIIHWTEIMHKYAYKILESKEYKKFALIVPSYNNPNPAVLTGMLSKMNDKYNWPIIVFVRESQYDSYVEGTKWHKYVTVVPYKDELIDDAGKARRWSLKWIYQNGYEHAFSFDDDALALTMTKKGFTGKGDPKSEVIKNTDISSVLACWQLSMMALESKYSNVALTAPYPVSFSWKAEYSWSTESALLYRGNLNQVVCLNVKNLIENGIIYESNKISGHEDQDLLLQCLKNNMLVATFPFVCYATPPMNVDNFTMFGATMVDRFATQQKLMQERWGDFPYVTFRDKRGLAQVIPNFRKYRKDYNIDPYVIDIWNNGEILE